MADAEDVVDEIEKQIQNKIDDPNPNRSDEEIWVKTIPSEFDIPEYPKVHLQLQDGVHTGYSFGTGRLIDTPLQISIFHGIDKSYRLDVDGDSELEPVKDVVRYLIKEITDLINKNQNLWENVGDNIHYVVTTNDNRVDNATNTDKIHHVVEAEIRLNR